MKTILWCQGDSTSSPDLYVLNGEIVSDENQKQLLAGELSSCRSFGMYHKENFKKARKEGRLKENAYVAYTDRGIFISSNFATCDVVGRQIVFEFFCETKDFSIAISELEKVSEQNKRECDKKELEELKNVVEEKKINNSSTTKQSSDTEKKSNRILIIVIIVVVLGLLLKLGSSSGDSDKQNEQTIEIKK